MKLPNHKAAFVPREKIVDYLLSDSHPRGRTKAVFYKRFGFRQKEWHILAEALVEHAAKYDAVFIETTNHGVCYNVVGELRTPSGRSPTVVSAWFFDNGSEIPRLITAVPD